MWSTPIQVHNGYEKPIKRYTDYLQEFFQLDLKDFKYDIREWETTPESGYWMAPHNHGHSHFTSIYYEYVSGEGGELILHDPRNNANRGFPQEFGKSFAPFIFEPKTDTTIIFPSYVYHTAAPFRGIVRKATVTEIQLNSSRSIDELIDEGHINMDNVHLGATPI
jgi:hypothetical protein